MPCRRTNFCTEGPNNTHCTPFVMNHNMFVVIGPATTPASTATTPCKHCYHPCKHCYHPCARYIAAATEEVFDKSVLLAVDTLQFHDPHHEPGLKNHCGLHPAILDGLLRNPEEFKTVCRKVKRMANRDMCRLQLGPFAGQGRARCILFYCRSGRHRSVGCSELIRWCLDKDQEEEGPHKFLQVPPPLHLSSRGWKKLCCGTIYLDEKKTKNKKINKQKK